MKKFTMIALIFVAYGASAFAQNSTTSQQNVLQPKIANDEVGNVGAVWKSFDASTKNYFLRGAFSKPGEALRVENVTDSTQVNVCGDPCIALSQRGSLPLGVAVWKAQDLATKNYVIQAALLTGLPTPPWSGYHWNLVPVATLSLNDGTEEPLDDLHASMSNDGKVISVIWSSSLHSSQDQVFVRTAITDDGGKTWVFSANQ